VIESASVTGAGLQPDGGTGWGPSTVYLAALVASSFAAVVVGVLVFLALAVWPVPVAIVAMAVVAVAAGSWCDEFVAPFDRSVDGIASSVLGVTRWVPVAVLAVAVAASGLRTSGRVIGAALGVALLWLGTAAGTAVTSALSSRALLPYPRELADYAFAVFRSASGPAGTGLTMGLVAAVAGATGAAAVAVVRARRR
jgi:iron complex transport system permease protein